MPLKNVHCCYILPRKPAEEKFTLHEERMLLNTPSKPSDARIILLNVLSETPAQAMELRVAVLQPASPRGYEYIKENLLGPEYIKVAGLPLLRGRQIQRVANAMLNTNYRLSFG